MRVFISGSAPLLLETFNDFKERTGHTILERYGMSETVMLTSNPCRASDGERIGGTVGRPLPGVQLRIVDDDGAACARRRDRRDRGARTERVRRLLAHAGEDERGVQRRRAGERWFKTGDVGSLNEDGYLTIVGRSKDLIISGGYNVYPAEVEGYINEMPGVAEAAVIGVPHPDFGEAVIAVVVRKPGAALDADAIVATLKHAIANFKVPKRIFVVDELPRNTMGKVQKNLLREQHQACTRAERRVTLTARRAQAARDQRHAGRAEQHAHHQRHQHLQRAQRLALEHPRHQRVLRQRRHPQVPRRFAALVEQRHQRQQRNAEHDDGAVGLRLLEALAADRHRHQHRRQRRRERQQHRQEQQRLAQPELEHRLQRVAAQQPLRRAGS